jgi:hypothetical protein
MRRLREGLAVLLIAVIFLHFVAGALASLLWVAVGLLIVLLVFSFIR